MSKLSDKFDILSNKLTVAKKTRLWFLVPVIMLLVTIIMYSIFAAVDKDFSKGINLGLDFTGGSSITVSFDTDFSDEQFNDYGARIVNIIEEVAAENNETYDISQPQRTGSGVDSAIYVKYQNGESDIQAINQEISDRVVSAFAANNITADDNISIQSISASSARKLAKEALIAVLITWAVILVYIVIRFSNFKVKNTNGAESGNVIVGLFSGTAAVVGLFFDVLTMVCMTIIFHVQVNTVFIAALITIVAYSINNTIVVFDRIRDRSVDNSFTKENIATEVDTAVQNSLMRSISTTVTTMLTILMLTIIGVDSIRQFTIPVIFGLISGVFTSLFMAPSLYVSMLMAWFKRKEKVNPKHVDDETKVDNSMATEDAKREAVAQARSRKMKNSANRSVKYNSNYRRKDKSSK